MTSKLISKSVTRWAVCEWDMVVSNVVEEVDLFLLQHETGGNRVDGSIAPSFVEKAAILVQRLEEVNVGFGAEPVQVTNLEVGPLSNISS